MLAVRASLPSSGLRVSQVGTGASSSRSFGSRALCNAVAPKVASSASVGGSKLVSGRYSKVSRTLSAKYAQKSQTKFQHLSTRSYSTTAPHPTQDASAAPVSVLDTLTKEYPTSSITQESMLLKLEDLVPLPNTFAVVQVGGHQFKVTQGDQIMISEIDVPIQTSILLDKVMMVGSTDYTVIGQPMIPSAKVLATVEEHEQTEKVIIYKKRRRKTYARKTGHRQPYTLLRINDILGAKQAPL